MNSSTQPKSTPRKINRTAVILTPQPNGQNPQTFVQLGLNINALSNNLSKLKLNITTQKTKKENPTFSKNNLNNLANNTKIYLRKILFSLKQLDFTHKSHEKFFNHLTNNHLPFLDTLKSQNENSLQPINKIQEELCGVLQKWVTAKFNDVNSFVNSFRQRFSALPPPIQTKLKPEMNSVTEINNKINGYRTEFQTYVKTCSLKPNTSMKDFMKTYTNIIEKYEKYLKDVKDLIEATEKRTIAAEKRVIAERKVIAAAATNAKAAAATKANAAAATNAKAPPPPPESAPPPTPSAPPPTPTPNAPSAPPLPTPNAPSAPALPTESASPPGAASKINFHKPTFNLVKERVEQLFKIINDQSEKTIEQLRKKSYTLSPLN